MLRRLKKEKGEHCFPYKGVLDLVPTDESLRTWVAVVSANCTTFTVNLELSVNYPFSAPIIEVITPGQQKHLIPTEIYFRSPSDTMLMMLERIITFLENSV